jgi:hypothetical protein
VWLGFLIPQDLEEEKCENLLFFMKQGKIFLSKLDTKKVVFSQNLI